MPNDLPDYQVLLDDLIARRAKIDAAISVIQELMGVVQSGSGNANIGGTSGAGRNAVVQSDSFFGMTILDAAKKYLAMSKRAKNAGEITEALRDGGYTFSTGSPLNTVTSVLNRSDTKGGDVVRVGKGTFGLAEWYPGRPKRKKGADKAEATDEAVSEAEPSPQSEGDETKE